MASALLFSILEFSTLVVTFLVIASGLPSCVRMYKSRSTKGVPFMMFLVYAFVSTLCMQYGLMIGNKVLGFINAFALMVWIGYISVYFLVTPSKSVAFMKASAVLFMYWAHLQYLAMIAADQVLPTLGFYMLAWCTILAILPFADILTMIKEKSCECDMSMLVATTISSVVWIMYGVLLNDINIWFSSVIALIVNIIKFVLIFLYSTSTKPKKPIERSVKKSDATNGHGHVTTAFHEEVYNVKARKGLSNRH